AQTTAQAKSWNSVTYGNGLFVAVGFTAVMTSPDGTTWTPRISADDAEWNSVTYTNGLFVAVGFNAVMTSPDGTTWTPRRAAEDSMWTSVTYGNGLFVAVAEYGTSRVMTSMAEVTQVGLSVTSAALNFKGADLIMRGGYQWT